MSNCNGADVYIFTVFYIKFQNDRKIKSGCENPSVAYIIFFR